MKLDMHVHTIYLRYVSKDFEACIDLNRLKKICKKFCLLKKQLIELGIKMELFTYHILLIGGGLVYCGMLRG